MKTILIFSVVEIAIAALLFILWHFRRVYSRDFIGEPAIAANDARMTALMSTRAPDAPRWEFINNWQLRPQADDRSPVGSSDEQSEGSVSGRRSMARRRRQAMYKQWSQVRHE